MPSELGPDRSPAIALALFETVVHGFRVSYRLPLHNDTNAPIELDTVEATSISLRGQPLAICSYMEHLFSDALDPDSVSVYELSRPLREARAVLAGE